MTFRKNSALTQFSNSALAFFAQVVSLSSLLVNHLSGAGNFESLLSPAIRFHFWHVIFKLKLIKQKHR
jgi:hypothetical protein